MTTELVKHGAYQEADEGLTVRLVGAGMLDYPAINMVVGRSVIGGEGTSQKRFLSSQFVGNLYQMIPVYFCISGPAVLINQLGPSLFNVKQVDHRLAPNRPTDNIIRTILGLGSIDEWKTCLAYSNPQQSAVVNELAEAVYQGLKSIGFGPYLLQTYRRHEWHGRPIFTRIR